MLYRVEFIVDDEIAEDIQADACLQVETIVDVGDESGLGIVGRIIAIRIRADREAS